MFRSATRHGVVDPSNVQDAADSFFTCQRVTQWSKAHLVRSGHESKALVMVDREAHFRSLTEQAKAAEYQGNVKVLYKLTREAAGQPRIKPVPSVMMDDKTTMGDGGSTSRSCSKVVLRRLQTFVHAQPDASSVQDHA